MDELGNFLEQSPSQFFGDTPTPRRGFASRLFEGTPSLFAAEAAARGLGKEPTAAAAEVKDTAAVEDDAKVKEGAPLLFLEQDTEASAVEKSQQESQQQQQQQQQQQLLQPSVKRQRRLLFHDNIRPNGNTARLPSIPEGERSSNPQPTIVVTPVKSRSGASRAGTPRKRKREQQAIIRVKIEQQLKRFLNPKAKQWCMYEWFYSNIDFAYLKHSNEFVTILQRLGLQDLTKATRHKWSEIRKTMGQARRFSPKFLAQQREALHSHRNNIHRIRNGLHAEPPLDKIPSHINPNSQVLALRHPRGVLQIARGEVVAINGNAYMVRFDGEEQPVKVQDIDVMPHAIDVKVICPVREVESSPDINENNLNNNSLGNNANENNLNNNNLASNSNAANVNSKGMKGCEGDKDVDKDQAPMPFTTPLRSSASSLAQTAPSSYPFGSSTVVSKPSPMNGQLQTPIGAPFAPPWTQHGVEQSGTIYPYKLITTPASSRQPTAPSKDIDLLADLLICLEQKEVILNFLHLMHNFARKYAKQGLSIEFKEKYAEVFCSYDVIETRLSTGLRRLTTIEPQTPTAVLSSSTSTSFLPTTPTPLAADHNPRRSSGLLPFQEGLLSPLGMPGQMMFPSPMPALEPHPQQLQEMAIQVGQTAEQKLVICLSRNPALLQTLKQNCSPHIEQLLRKVIQVVLSTSLLPQSAQQPGLLGAVLRHTISETPIKFPDNTSLKDNILHTIHHKFKN